MQISIASRTVFALIAMLSALFSFLYATKPAKVAALQLGLSTLSSPVSAMWGRHVGALLGAYALMLASAAISGSADRSLFLFACVYEIGAVANNESTSGTSLTTCMAHRLRCAATLAVSAYELWTASHQANAVKSFCLNVKLCVKPERRSEFIDCIQNNQKGTLATEPLAIEYVWGEDTAEANTFHFYEQYQGRQGFEAHQTTEHFAAWERFAATEPFTAQPVVSFYEEKQPATKSEAAGAGGTAIAGGPSITGSAPKPRRHKLDGETFVGDLIDEDKPESSARNRKKGLPPGMPPGFRG